EGFVVLCHSHPGHGESEGPKPKPNNMIYEDDEEYNESAHFYLTLCGAIQGLRVLENLTIVDNSKIMITGASYGALNTMWLSGICGDRIAGALPYIMVGDFEKSLEDPTKLIFWLLGENAENIEEGSNWEEINLRFDPIYYLESEKLPPILWQVGTNDEFFHYHQIKGTYEAVENEDEAFLQIYPNAHHGFPGFENNTKFFIDYIIDNGPAPPKIDIKEYPKEYGIFGDTMKIKVKLDSEEDIESVQVCYKYLDIVGSSWEVFDLKKSGNMWTGLLGPGIITSKVDYYIIVNLEGEEDMWFSSIIYTPGTFISNFTIPFYILLGSFIALPIIYLIWRRFKIDFQKLDKKIQPKAKKDMLIEFITIGIAEALFYISLILPWIVFVRGDIIWTHIYIFNNIFTWKMILGVFATYLTAIFIIGWILYSHLSFSKPMLSGLLKMVYPIFILLMFGIFISMIGLQDPESWIFDFELVYPGIGIYLMLFASILLIVIGIWKRKYQTKLEIREPKKKWYNIDKWFKIKIPVKSKRNTKICFFIN
ncbi:MAG: alpha/beta hydrolase family protein, partial [Promethearchaeota archaeon]